MCDKRSADQDGQVSRAKKHAFCPDDDGACASPVSHQPTPPPISHPFGQRFSAPELSRGQYHVLDELSADEDVDEAGASTAYDSTVSASEDEADQDQDHDDDDGLGEDELMNMLDAGLPEEFQGTRRVKRKALPGGAKQDGDCEQAYEHREKVVLIERGRRAVEPLPEGWVMATHCSGMPVYLHRASRVASITRPYFLGPGSIRKHDIPLHSIPCLHYLKELQKLNSKNSGSEAKDTVKEVENAGSEAGSDVIKVGNIKSETQDDALQCTNGTAESVDIITASTNGITESGNDVTESTNGGAERVCDVITSTNHITELQNDVTESTNRVADIGNDVTESTNGVGNARNDVTRVDNDVSADDDVNVEGKDPSVTSQQLFQYCRRRFNFRTLKLLKFNSWKHRRQYSRTVRTQRPQMSDKTKLLCFPMKPGDGEAAGRSREWVLNPTGKTWVCIFHEYLQRVLRQQPVYTYTELENSATPYCATASVDSIQYGTGVGSSKKHAKAEAARASLLILIPAQMKHIMANHTSTTESSGTTTSDTTTASTKAGVDQTAPMTAPAAAPAPETTSIVSPCDMDLSFFDSIRLEDPRVADLCKKASEPSPYTILIMCLQRNFGVSSGDVTCRLTTSQHQRNQFEMRVGQRSATAHCRNKKDGKQLAAQSLLQQLHPQLTSWGSLLRMYGNYSTSSLKARRQQERQITALQRQSGGGGTSAAGEGGARGPNTAILDKLRCEMLKLRDSKHESRPIGTLQLSDTDDLPSHSAVSLDMVEL